MQKTTTASGARRKQTRTVRREQLILATIASLAERGYADTTLADVARGAGLSQGIVNFHFDSKRNLLEETLRYLSDEYSAVWQEALDGAGASPAERLWALVGVDFDPRICTANKVAAWCAFWGEARSRPIYLAMCGVRDEEYQTVLHGVCEELATQGGYAHDPARVALGIDALSEGLWLRVGYDDREFRRDDLHACAIDYLVALFPDHFTVDGPRRACSL